MTGDRWAGQGFTTWNSDLWTLSADLLRIAPDFQADIGFIRRRDILRHNYRLSWKPRPRTPWLRQLFATGTLEHIADLSGALQSRTRSARLNVRLESGDDFFAAVSDNFERLERPFQIDPRVAIPAGDYAFQETSVGVTFFDGRAVAGSLSAGVGEFFNGTRQSLTLAPTVRVGRAVQASVSYSYNRIDLPQGGFATHLINSGFSYSFNNRWLTNTSVQYSDTSGLLTVFAQLDFIYRENDDIFVIYEQVSGVGRGVNGLVDHKLVVKMTRSFDF